ncbi:hypothetical protein ACVGVM_27975 (plasmid) [Pseudonocardia bannensis]|uniref:Uncharacterized protein n=1 Tax=Pseudonocardia bannensis TaxID=630973 RepID=A0A848DI71_9PSEU|nr:hypothetical protein [Pseudonocardia bannensis]NMH92387.1 hypothetical protein [Pseudonocardia bannensis]
MSAGEAWDLPVGPFIPGAMPPLPAASWTIAVVNDAAAPREPRAATGPGLHEDAAVIADLSGVRAVPLSMVSRDAAHLATTLHRLPLDIGAIFLTRTDLARARETQQLLTELGGRPLVIDDDARAITLTAALLTYLTRLHRPLPTSRVMIAGAASLPLMCPMLLSAGIFDITLWNPQDARCAALARVARDADAVINLLGPDPELARVALDRPCGSVIGLDGDTDHLLALPGLFRAIAGSPGPLVDIEAYAACARGLMAAAPPHRLLPSLRSPDLTYEVAAAASQVFNPVPPPFGRSWRLFPSRRQRDRPEQR